LSIHPTEPKQRLRVLLLEDAPTDAELMEQELRSAGIEFVSRRVDNEDSFLEALDRFSPEIILSDYSLPAFDGESAFSIARERAPGVPYIFVTGALGEDRAVDLLKSGATDFVLKNRLTRLPLCVTRALEEVEEKRHRQHAEEELRRAYAELEREIEKRTGELRQRTLELQQLTGTLEKRVQERTSELSEAVESLRAENIRCKRLEDQVRFFASQCLTAQETERKRVAGELHDSIAASLAAIKFRIEKTADDMNQDRASAQSLQDLGTAIAEINDEVRRIMADLRPSVLDDLGIIPAMEWFCREYQKTYSHISVENQIGISEDEVPDSLRTPIFRICQEAMNNIAKYSKASLVNLFLRKEDNKLLLTIRDNGKGFDLNTVRKGLGLSTMRERAELSGGAFDLESAIGKGTMIRVSWTSPAP